jgi:hypothetical protein
MREELLWGLEEYVFAFSCPCRRITERLLFPSGILKSVPGQWEAI